MRRCKLPTDFLGHLSNSLIIVLTTPRAWDTSNTYTSDNSLADKYKLGARRRRHEFSWNNVDREHRIPHLSDTRDSHKKSHYFTYICNTLQKQQEAQQPAYLHHSIPKYNVAAALLNIQSCVFIPRSSRNEANYIAPSLFHCVQPINVGRRQMVFLFFLLGKSSIQNNYYCSMSSSIVTNTPIHSSLT